MTVRVNCWTLNCALPNQRINYIFASGIKKDSCNFISYFVSEKQAQRLQTSTTNTCDVNFIWNVCSLLWWYLTDAFWSSYLWWRSQAKEHHNQNLYSKYKRCKHGCCRTISTLLFPFLLPFFPWWLSFFPKFLHSTSHLCIN